MPGRSLQVGSAAPTETYLTQSSGCSTSSSQDTQARWKSGWEQVHQGDPAWRLAELALPVRAEDRVGEILLSRTWTRSQGDGVGSYRWVDTTTVEVVHKPLT